MAGKIFCRVAVEPLNPADAFLFLADPAHGAADIFIGTVRDFNMGKVVQGISYDVFDELALTVFQSLAEEIQTRWGADSNVFIEHFKGHQDIGGVSVVVAVSSRHRDESFKACRFLIEEIKHRAPIWKQEHYLDGDSEWVQGHALCGHHGETHCHHDHNH